MFLFYNACSLIEQQGDCNDKKNSPKKKNAGNNSNSKINAEKAVNTTNNEKDTNMTKPAVEVLEDESTVVAIPKDEPTVVAIPKDESTEDEIPEVEPIVAEIPKDEPTVVETPKDESTVEIINLTEESFPESGASRKSRSEPAEKANKEHNEKLLAIILKNLNLLDAKEASLRYRASVAKKDSASQKELSAAS